MDLASPPDVLAPSVVVRAESWQAGEGVLLDPIRSRPASAGVGSSSSSNCGTVGCSKCWWMANGDGIGGATHSGDGGDGS